MKLHLLDLGRLDYDEGWPLLAAGVSTASEPAPAAPRRTVAMIASLIEHPKVGPVLFDTGAAPNYKELWPPVVQELFAISTYDASHHLDAALEAAGFGVDDIRAIVLSHLHLDHAGGLELFRGRDIPVYVHADELRNGFYAVATGQDVGAYIPHYLDFSFNWMPLHGDHVELFDGFELHRLPGHTPALMSLRLDLANSGTHILTSDQFHLRDNYEGPHPLGWLMRDQPAWWRSCQYVKTLADRTDATLVFGHDPDVLTELRREGARD
ncbi:MAG TPA: N-acyl homoserine lactonase family protein [Solirubrobacteraceae bacterium]|jgi:glyoxylase-like metal-dependent hydrolase (beta-lactamase superfamily II)